MSRFLLLSFLYLSIYISGWAEVYRPDTSGNNYQSQTIEMPEDYEGRVVCTLIRKKSSTISDKAILYVHGYNDYFFQTDLGDSIIAHGYNFYALDLRKYGRSLLPDQDAFYCKNLAEYFPDLDTALSTIRTEGNSYVVLMGHSTGGLITSLYLDNKSSSCIKGLILNSPFLDMNMNWFMEKIIVPSGSFWGGLFPRTAVKQDRSTYYAQSLLKDFKGEWDFNTDWKKPEGHPQRLGWVRAIYKGQQKIKKGLSLQCPILVMSSDKSVRPSKEWRDHYLHADIVLDVKDIQKYGIKLGATVSVCAIANGMHDLILSPEPARSAAYQTIFDWLNQLR